MMFGKFLKMVKDYRIENELKRIIRLVFYFYE